MESTIVNQLKPDGHFAKIPAIKISEPFANACTGVIPLSTASVRHSGESTNRYFVCTHLEGTFEDTKDDDFTNGENKSDETDDKKVMARPDTVFKVCQMVNMGQKSGSQNVVAVVCTITRQTAYNVSPAVAIDEKKQALYIAYAPPPDLSAESIEDRRPAFVAIEEFPISFESFNGGSKLCVNKSSPTVYRTPVQSRIPVRLFVHPECGSLYMAANKSLSTLKPQSRLFHCTHLTRATGKFLLQPVAGMNPEKPTELLKCLEFDASTAQASFSDSAPCSVRDTDAAQYMCQDDMGADGTVPNGPVLVQFVTNVLPGKDDSGWFDWGLRLTSFVGSSASFESGSAPVDIWCRCQLARVGPKLYAIPPLS